MSLLVVPRAVGYAKRRTLEANQNASLLANTEWALPTGHMAVKPPHLRMRLWLHSLFSALTAYKPEYPGLSLRTGQDHCFASFTFSEHASKSKDVFETVYSAAKRYSPCSKGC